MGYQDKLETIQKLAKIGLWELDLINNKLSWSNEIYNIFELDKDEFEPSYEKFLEVIFEDDRELVNSSYLKSLEDKKDYSIIHRLKMQDGRIKYVEEQCETIFDKDGKPLVSHGTVQDITEITIANKKLFEEAKELEAIFNNTIDGLAIMDKETNFIKVNKTYCELTGYSEEELLQTSCLALTAPEDLEKTLIANQAFLEGNDEKATLEKTCLGKDRRIEARLYASWLPNKEHMLINMKDLSKDNLLQEQAKLFSMKEMIENIAHQWRQPLSTISSIASGINLLDRYNKLESHNFQKDMNLILDQVNILSNTIDDLSNFIVTNGSLERASLVKIVEQSLNIFKPSIKMNSLDIITNFNEDIYIDAYVNELIQAFLNILNNSKDALLKQNNKRVIFVSTKKTENGLELEFKDCGGGVAKENLNRLFEPYFTTKHQSFGTGIGLSMTYKFLVERHSCDVKVENCSFVYEKQECKGLAFKILFKA